MKEIDSLDALIEHPLCKNCVNFVEENNIVFCEYDYFQNISLENALLYMPILFNCFHYEEK